MSAPVTAQEGLAGFASIISVYEHRIGHVCREVASHLPSLLSSFPEEGGKVLDNACGTGAVSEEIVKVFPTAEIHAVDVVPPMVQSFRAVIASSPTLQRRVKEVRLEDSQSLTFADDFFDVSITNFGIFFFPDPVAGARHIHRTLKPGGTAVVSVWKTFGFKPILWAIQDRLKPANPLLELPLMEPWCEASFMENVLKNGGFDGVKTSAMKATLWGKDKEDFKKVLMENLGAMTARNWTEEERGRLPQYISQVVDEEQDRFCVVSGEKVGCEMEAWVAVATKQTGNGNSIDGNQATET